MNLTQKKTNGLKRLISGFTLAEFMVASGAGVLLMTAVVLMGVFSIRSFTSLGNYTELDEKSRYALDIISREIREATAITAIVTNLPTRSITLSNSTDATFVSFTWDSNTEKLNYFKTGVGTETLLTGCDDWKVAMYTRAPTVTATNIIFYPAATVSQGKLVDMSWRCYRSMISKKLNTESVQTAQVILRNKTN